MSTAGQLTSRNTPGNTHFQAIRPSKYLQTRLDLLQKGQRVLLVADGEGRNSVWCAEMGMNVDAFDACADAVERARQLAQARRVSVMYNISCCESWDWQPAQYDAVIIICANFATPAMRNALFENCMNTLKPGGIFLLKGHSIRQLAVLMRENLAPEQLKGFDLDALSPDTVLNGVAIGEHYYSEALLRDAFSSLQIMEIIKYTEPARKKDGTIRYEELIGMVARKGM